MKQTAVDWLINMLVTENEVTLKGENYKLFEQAKQMEKEQSIAFGYRCIGEVDCELGDLIYKKVPEEIYNETFKSE